MEAHEEQPTLIHMQEATELDLAAVETEPVQRIHTLTHPIQQPLQLLRLLQLPPLLLQPSLRYQDF